MRRRGLLFLLVVPLGCFGATPEAVSVRQAVTNGVEVRWFETWMPAEDGARLYTYGTAPKEGVRCPIVVQRNPYVPDSPASDASGGALRSIRPN